ncbi:MAG: peptidase [Alphaproteobacteria bacterium]|nr:peptidase [Alphaproteobacteria bacterium]
MTKTARIISALLLFTALATPTISCAQQPASAEKKPKVGDNTYEMLNLFGDVFERVRENYVEEVPDKKLVESALNGMLTALDPHSGYLDEASFDDMKVQTKGEFGGLGIEVTMENGLVKVVSPIDETPAAKAGIKAGDFVIKIGPDDVMGMTLSDAVGKMKGKIGTPITLTIVRQDKPEPFEVKLVRDTIKVKAVRYRMQGDDVGYIRITSFNEQVEENLGKAIKDLKEKNKNLKGFVLDLRNNPGGLLDQAIAVSDTFLEKGEIVSTRGRRAEETKRVNATPGDMIDHMPLVVLINEGSASASEIVAGALQDHHRGILMGTKSFGKGSVQTIISLPGNGAMRLTTARYYTPSGRSIQAEGIKPDIEVKPAKIEEVVDKLAKFMPKEADLKGALKNDTLQKAIDEQQKKLDKDKGTPGAEEEADAADYQLQRANDLIRGIARYVSNDENSSGEVKQVEETKASNDNAKDEKASEDKTPDNVKPPQSMEK